jgi:hypothetical protein
MAYPECKLGAAPGISGSEGEAPRWESSGGLPFCTTAKESRSPADAVRGLSLVVSPPCGYL